MLVTVLESPGAGLACTCTNVRPHPRSLLHLLQRHRGCPCGGVILRPQPASGRARGAQSRSNARAGLRAGRNRPLPRPPHSLKKIIHEGRTGGKAGKGGFGPFLLRLLTKTVCSTVCSHEWCSVVMIVGLGGPEGGMNNTLMFEIKSDKCTQNNRFSRSPSKRIKPVTSNQ